MTLWSLALVMQGLRKTLQACHKVKEATTTVAGRRARTRGTSVHDIRVPTQGPPGIEQMNEVELLSMCETMLMGVLQIVDQ